MLKNNEMILPKNFMAMSEDEMMNIDGGNWILDGLKWLGLEKVYKYASNKERHYTGTKRYTNAHGTVTYVTYKNGIAVKYRVVSSKA